MTIFKVPGGWLFKYSIQPENSFYYIEDNIPYFAEATKINLDLRGHEVEYHVLPYHIKVAIAATQSVLVEDTVSKNLHLCEVIENMTKKDD